MLDGELDSSIRPDLPTRALPGTPEKVEVMRALALTPKALGPWPGVNARNVRRIKPGMTLQEVEAVLGGPANRRLFIDGVADLTSWHTWQGADRHAEVAFGRLHPSPYEAVTSADG